MKKGVVMKIITAGLLAAMLAVAATPASAAEFAFLSGKNPASWTVDEITLSVRGWSTSTARSDTPAAGSATAYSGAGYGVINASSDNSHTIDNSGAYDFVRLDFSKAVTLDKVTLAQFGDTDAWVSYGDKATNMTSTAGWSSFVNNGADYLGGNVNRSFSVGKNVAASVWLIGAGRNTGTNDSFKLSSINVTAAVPEPATWAMMLVGFGSVGAAMRRRKSKVATSVSYA